MCSQKVRTANAALHARAIKIFDKAMLKSLIRLLEQYAPFVLLVSYAFKTFGLVALTKQKAHTALAALSVLLKSLQLSLIRDTNQAGF